MKKQFDVSSHSAPQVAVENALAENALAESALAEHNAPSTRRQLPAEARPTRKRRGFTLLEMVVVIGVIAVLAALALGWFGQSREGARRVQCDVRLKAIALGLDAFRQEHGRFPTQLAKLRDDGYLTEPDALRCPSDALESSTGYEPFYAIRAPRDSSELPILVCPMHEATGNHGAQAFVGRYTTHSQASPAVLEASGGATVQHPGQKEAVAATANMPLRGGDRIRGSATIRFADGSTAVLQSGSDVTVLQSFIDGHAKAPLYTLVRQTLGDVTYRIHTGSKFDVVTPTATAGAHGTEFRIVVDSGSAGSTRLFVIEGKVSLATVKKSGFAPLGEWVEVDSLGNILGGLLP